MIEKHNKIHKKKFNELREIYLEHINHPVSINHVGSTAIPDLIAKPIIDILITVEDDIIPEITKDLVSIGYNAEGEKGIPGRYSFKLVKHDLIEPINHHLYVGNVNNIHVQNLLMFKDHLLKYPNDAKAYGELKERIVKTTQDRAMYTKMKTEFITNILKQYIDVNEIIKVNE